MATAEPTTETGTASVSDTTTSKEASHMSKAQGQFTIIDYNDALTLTGYIASPRHRCITPTTGAIPRTGKRRTSF